MRKVCVCCVWLSISQIDVNLRTALVEKWFCYVGRFRIWRKKIISKWTMCTFSENMWRISVGENLGKDFVKKLLLWGLSLSLSLPLSVFLSLYLCPYWERIWRSLMKSQRPLMTMPSITLMETLQGVQGHNPTKKHQSLTTKEDIGNMIQHYLLQPFENHNQSCTCTSRKSTHDILIHRHYRRQSQKMILSNYVFRGILRHLWYQMTNHAL